MQPAAPKESDAAIFWLAWAYGAGLVGSLAFTGVVLLAASEPLFPERTTTVLFTWVFLGVLVFLALAFVLSILGVPRGVARPVLRYLHPRDAEFVEVLRTLGIGVSAVGGGSGAERTGRMSESLRRALGAVLPLAAILLILSLLAVVGFPLNLPGGPHVANARAVFGLLGLFVLLVPGLAYVFLAAHRSRAATPPPSETISRRGRGRAV